MDKIATISDNNDNKIGKLIYDIMEKIGSEGSINVQSWKILKHEVEFSKEIKFNNGFISQYFGFINIKQFIYFTL